MRFPQRNARRAFDFLGAFRHDPRRAFLHAGFFQQQRQRHAGPLRAARQTVRFLHRLVSGLRAVAEALDEVNARHGRQPLQLVHREDQRPIDHAVDHQFVLARIDVRHERAAMRRHVVERRRRDDADRVLQRREHVKRQPVHVGRHAFGDRHAHGLHEVRALAVRDELLGQFLRACRRRREPPASAPSPFRPRPGPARPAPSSSSEMPDGWVLSIALVAPWRGDAVACDA